MILDFTIEVGESNLEVTVSFVQCIISIFKNRYLSFLSQVLIRLFNRGLYTKMLSLKHQKKKMHDDVVQISTGNTNLFKDYLNILNFLYVISQQCKYGVPH